MVTENATADHMAENKNKFPSTPTLWKLKEFFIIQVFKN